MPHITQIRGCARFLWQLDIGHTFDCIYVVGQYNAVLKTLLWSSSLISYQSVHLCLVGRVDICVVYVMEGHELLPIM